MRREQALAAVEAGVRDGVKLGQESERRRIRPALAAVLEELNLGRLDKGMDLLRDTLRFLDDPSYIPGAPQ